MYARYGSLQTAVADRDQLVEHLLVAADLLGDFEGCLLYIVHKDPENEELTWIYELWRSEADHQASLALEAIQNLIAAARPLLTAAPEGSALLAMGGKGVTG